MIIFLLQLKIILLCSSPEYNTNTYNNNNNQRRRKSGYGNNRGMIQYGDQNEVYGSTAIMTRKANGKLIIFILSVFTRHITTIFSNVNFFG